MTTIKRTAETIYSAEQMYELVNAIEEYPEFLPWCNATEILKRTPDEIHATLHLSKGGIRRSFSTCNRLQKNKMIEVRLLEGPFRHLEGFWHFQNRTEIAGSSISLDLEFEFHTVFLDLALGPIFNQVANSLVDHFSERAHFKYGKQGSVSP